jgi:hypothetical protein
MYIDSDSNKLDVEVTTSSFLSTLKYYYNGSPVMNVYMRQYTVDHTYDIPNVCICQDWPTFAGMVFTSWNHETDSIFDNILMKYRITKDPVALAEVSAELHDIVMKYKKVVEDVKKQMPDAPYWRISQAIPHTYKWENVYNWRWTPHVRTVAQLYIAYSQV